AGRWAAFSRFPTWMWRNVEVAEFVDWLHGFNRGLAQEHRTGFFGLDVYSLQRSIAAVLQYLDQTDAELARQARRRYGRLDRWTGQPAAYGFAAATDAADSCEEAVVANLRTLLAQDSATSLPSPVRPSPAPGDA